MASVLKSTNTDGKKYFVRFDRIESGEKIDNNKTRIYTFSGAMIEVDEPIEGIIDIIRLLKEDG